LADKLIENVVGVFGVAMGVAVNFQVNGRDVLVPMVIEEPSVVAGASFMAKLAREVATSVPAALARDDRANSSA
jgi:hydroxymethylglutaryl-CoA reductase